MNIARNIKNAKSNHGALSTDQSTKLPNRFSAKKHNKINITINTFIIEIFINLLPFHHQF